MQNRGALLILLLVVTSTPVPGRGADDPRLTLLLDAGLGLEGRGFEASRRLHEFAEDGRLTSATEAAAGPVFGGALQVRVGSRLGVLLGVAASHRDHEGTWDARFPHPLYLNRHRLASGSFTGSSREREAYVAVAWLARSGRADFRVFAGPAFVRVSADTLAEVGYTHAFPYDEIAATRVATQTRKGSGLGFTGGAGADWRFGRNVALGLTGRYNRASVSFDASEADGPLDVDAGGLSVTAGFRASF